MSSWYEDNKHVPIPPAEFERRCKKLFGKNWINTVAYNLKRTPSYIRAIRTGVVSTTEELLIILDGWERGKIPVRKCPTIKSGRPPKAEKAAE